MEVITFHGFRVQVGYYCRVLGPDSIGKWHIIKKVVNTSGYDNVLLVIDGMYIFKYLT